MVKLEEGLSLTQMERPSDAKKVSVLLVLRELSVGAKTKRQGKPSSAGLYMVKPKT